MNAILLSLFLFGLCCGDDNDFQTIDSIRQEAPCSSEGGMCTIAADCPEGQLTEQRGLCPMQQSLGVECCYGISVKETRCRKHGGECKPNANFCAAFLVYQEATDCPENYKCCILV